MLVRFFKAAQAEIDDATAYFDEQREGLGERFKVVLQRTIDFILEHPYAGKRLADRVRKFRLSTFRYDVEMKSLKNICFLFLLAISPSLFAADPKAGIEAFNHATDAATRHMSNAEVLALWEDDGVSLLPSTAPIAGKKAIAQFLDQVTAQLKGAQMETFEMRCHDITVSGDWASEWCTEHQVVRFADPKQPPFDGRGTMLLVLHRGASGQWRLKTEMWNQAAATAK